jgi:hypothetical protein
MSAFRLKYAANTDHIEPVQRAGIIKLFTREQAEQIAAAAERISRQ